MKLQFKKHTGNCSAVLPLAARLAMIAMPLLSALPAVAQPADSAAGRPIATAAQPGSRISSTQTMTPTQAKAGDIIAGTEIMHCMGDAGYLASGWKIDRIDGDGIVVMPVVWTNIYSRDADARRNSCKVPYGRETAIGESSGMPVLITAEKGTVPGTATVTAVFQKVALH